MYSTFNTVYKQIKKRIELIKGYLNVHLLYSVVAKYNGTRHEQSVL